VLHAVLKSNFAGTESFRLYSESYYGTKELVQEFIDEGTSLFSPSSQFLMSSYTDVIL